MPKTDAEIFDAALLASVEVVEDPRIAALNVKVSDLEARLAAMTVDRDEWAEATRLANRRFEQAEAKVFDLGAENAKLRKVDGTDENSARHRGQLDPGVIKAAVALIEGEPPHE